MACLRILLAGLVLAALPASGVAQDVPPQEPAAQEPAAQEPAAQEPPAQEPARQRPVVAEIVIEGAGAREQDVRQALVTQVGQPYDPERMIRDMSFLWQRMRIRLEEVLAEPMDGNRVRLILRVVPVRTLRRVVFEGNQKFEWDRLQLETGLAGAQEIDPESVPRVMEALKDFYRREGYARVEITARIEEERDQVRLLIQEGPLVRIGDVQFVGNEAFPGWTLFNIGNDLSGELESGDGWFIFPGSKYNEEAIRRDVVALERLYHAYGYLEAEVSVEKIEFYRENKRVRVVYHIREGPQYTVRSVRIEAADEATPLQIPAERLMQEIQLRPGMPYERDRVEQDEALLRRYYGQLGHPAAMRGRGEITSGFFQFNPPNGDPEALYDTEQHQVDVTYRLQEGRSMRVHDVIVRGNVHTRDAVVRREISLEPGELANTEEALRSTRRLLGLQYFTDPETKTPFVNWWFSPADREDWVDLNYEVAEGDTGRILFGGGINTNTGPFLSLTLQKQNFDLFDLPSSFGDALPEVLSGQAFTGRGQSLDLFLAPGTELSQYRLTFREPDLFGDHINRWSLSSSLFKTVFFLDTHDETRTGTRFTLGRNFGRFFQIYGAPEYQVVEIEDPEPGAPDILLETLGTNRMHGITLGAQYNTVEDPFNPVDGGRVGVSHRKVGGILGGDWDFHQNTFDAAKYFTLWQDGKGRPYVLALEGRLQWGAETGDLSGIPYSERYFLGGQSTVRGFDFRGIGPRENGFPLGGEAAWNATTEVRFPLVSSRVRGAVDEVEYIRGGLFLDQGSVGDDLSALGPTRVSVGVNLRMRIPFLPGLGLQLDFGFPIQSEPFDDEQVFSFNLGVF
ncbi:MAG: hypothetical protein EYC70_12055 [Planctomycetota bacterium]|nr:MAG: hypothetical protein EYC70_12055 [Planctomycetota bacterium]